MIRITRHINSEDLHLPELRSMIGKDVEITIRESARTGIDPAAFWQDKSLDELAAEQGLTGQTFTPPPTPLPADAFEGFDEALRDWRSHPERRK